MKGEEATMRSNTSEMKEQCELRQGMGQWDLIFAFYNYKK